MVNFCLSSFLLLYGGRPIWLKHVWDTGSLRKKKHRKDEELHEAPQRRTQHTQYLFLIHLVCELIYRDNKGPSDCVNDKKTDSQLESMEF